MMNSQRPKPGADDPIRTMLRLIGAFAAPVVIYLVAWELVARFVLPAFGASGQMFAVNLFSVLIPFAGVLASIYLAGAPVGRLLGGGVMAVFFLYLYVSSAVVFSWLPIALVLGGILLAVAVARFCPSMKPDLDGIFG